MNSEAAVKTSKSSDNLSSTSAEGPDRKLVLPLKNICSDQDKPLFAPDVEEVRVSPVVARKGYLNFLDEKSNGWIRKYVVGVQHGSLVQKSGNLCRSHSSNRNL